MHSSEHTTEQADHTAVTDETVHPKGNETVEHLCRNCGRQIDTLLQEYCGKPNCDERAAIRQIS